MKLILSMIYPFWLFLSKTWFGNVMMIPVVLIPFPGLIWLIGYILSINISVHEAIEAIAATEAIAISVAAIALLYSPLITGCFVYISFYLEKKYEQWGYKIEIETKMI